MKKKLDREAEKLEAMGLEEEKEGQATVMEVMKEEEEFATRTDAKVLERLHAAKKSVTTYNSLLAKLLTNWLTLISWPEGWTQEVRPTDIGVVLTLRYNGRVFQAAFKPTGIEKYDKAAVEAFVTRSENTMEKVMKSVSQENP